MFRLIKIQGVPKTFFNAIIMYLYSDHFYIGEHSIEFFLYLLIYSDYFMIDRVVQLATKYIKSFVNIHNVLSVYLIA